MAVLFFRLGTLDGTGLIWTLCLVAVLAAAALLLALYALSRAWRLGDKGGGRAASALALGFAVAIPYALGLALAAEYPTGNAAETSGMSEPAGTVAPDDVETEPDALLSRDYRATASQVYGATRTAIEAAGWDLTDVLTDSSPAPDSGDLGVSGTVDIPIPTSRTSVDPSVAVDPFAGIDADAYTIQAVAYAPVLALPSDVTIRVVEDTGDTFVDVRSVSRTVDWDLGQNRRFIEDFYERLDTAMTALQDTVSED